MAYNYLIPVIGSLPIGYACTIDPPLELVGRLLASGEGRLVWRTRVFHEGAEIESLATELVFENARLQGPRPAPRVCAIDNRSDVPGFFENDFVVADGSARFTSNMHPSGYVIYSAPGRKCFFSDCAYKYASPPTIDQIAVYGRFVDTYAPVSLDRRRDHGESVVLINPYSRALVAEIIASDGRRIPRIRVASLSARLVPLVQLLRPGEDAWRGRIQVSANNRVITFDIKHSLKSEGTISDHEHLDPFRADPTHLPAFQAARMTFGKFLMRRFGVVRR